jgi:hypothetical protein
MAKLSTLITGSVSILAAAFFINSGATGTFSLGPGLFRAFEARAAPVTAIPETITFDTTFTPALSDANVWSLTMTGPTLLHSCDATCLDGRDD